MVCVPVRPMSMSSPLPQSITPSWRERLAGFFGARDPSKHHPVHVPSKGESPGGFWSREDHPAIRDRGQTKSRGALGRWQPRSPRAECFCRCLPSLTLLLFSSSFCCCCFVWAHLDFLSIPQSGGRNVKTVSFRRMHGGAETFGREVAETFQFQSATLSDTRSNNNI